MKPQTISSMKNVLNRLERSLQRIKSKGIDIKEKEKGSLVSFKDREEELLRNEIRLAIREIKNYSFDRVEPEVEHTKLDLLEEKKKVIMSSYETGNIDLVIKSLRELKEKLHDLPASGNKELNFRIPPLPLEIKENIKADVDEIRKCFQADCFRSIIILCGRILETALFRKYFEMTKKDLLVTSPGLGLGKLIAKLKEENFQFDPGLSEQIHLINQMRIHSVHTKNELFTPTKNQTHAVILYTMDVLNKFF